MPSRWHQDTDLWVWRVYDNKDSMVNGNENTSDIYIIPQKGQWVIIDAKITMGNNKTDWITDVMAGKSAVVAGPFTELDHAKAAWRLIYG